MLNVGKEAARLAQQPSEERIRALKRIIPCSTVKRILKKCGRDRRFCPRLPNWFMVWFVIALGLVCPDSYRQIFRWLQRFRKKFTPGRSTLCEARHRLGLLPFRFLASQVVQLLATPATEHAWYSGMRLMAIDGFVVDVPDTPAHVRAFGLPKGGRTSGAFPQARVLSLCEAGTHVMWRWSIKRLACGESRMAHYLLGLLQPDMLLLWDRNFLSYANVTRVRARGAQLLARIKSNLIFRPLRRFADGSFLAKIYPSPSARDKDRDGVEVRIIEYTFDDPNRPGVKERHRLLTTLLDWKAHPAKRLIVLYHERWEEELAIDELKTHQRERPVLRSQTPAGVMQEIYGLLLGHFVIRKLMFEAAKECGVPPRRLSFTNTLKILRCRLPEVPKSPQGLKRWYADLLAEIGEEILEPRRDRINPRVVRQKVKKWPKKRPEHRKYPQPGKKIQRSIVMLR
jgi:hypothetical protein